MKQFIIILILLVILPVYAFSQTLIQTFTDPCTKVTSTFSIPITGTTVIVFYNRSKTFTAADISSGVFQTWLNQVYEDYRKLSPCSVAQVAQTSTTVTAAAVSSAVSSAVSAATSSAASTAASSAASAAVSSTPSAPAAPASSSSSSSSSSESSSSSSSSSESKSESKSESSSESKSEEKSESKSESKSEKKSESKKDSKSSNKSQARMNPILFNSDLTAGQNVDASVALVLTGGISQSSMTGATSWGVTGMVWSNLKQFVLSSRYTKMNFNAGKLESISNFGFTTAYMFGNLSSFLTYAYIYPLGKWGVTGANYTLSFSKDNLMHNLLLFYTKPIPVNRRLNLSPELYISGSPVVYTFESKSFDISQDMGFITGVSSDYSFTKRFKLNIGLRTSLSTNPQVPMLLFAVVGSKVNL